METPKKIVYENYCGICGARKITSKLCLVVTKRGEKTPIAVMLENYCRIIVTTENVSQYICVCCKKNLQTIVSKVDNFRENWMGKDNINREQAFRLKRMLHCLALILNNATRTPASKTGVELNISTTSLSEKVG